MNLDLFKDVNDMAGSGNFSDVVMVFFAEGMIYILGLMTAVILVYLAYKKCWRPIVLIVAASIVGLIISQVLGYMFPEARPFVDQEVNKLIYHKADQSFPSSHTTVAVTASIAVLWFTKFRVIGIIMISLAAVVGFSRIFVGVHYPFDVLGGAIVGLVSVYLVSLASKFISKESKKEN